MATIEKRTGELSRLHGTVEILGCAIERLQKEAESHRENVLRLGAETSQALLRLYSTLYQKVIAEAKALINANFEPNPHGLWIEVFYKPLRALEGCKPSNLRQFNDEQRLMRLRQFPATAEKLLAFAHEKVRETEAQ